MKQQKEPDIQLEQWNPPVKEWGPVYKAIFRALNRHLACLYEERRNLNP